MAFLAAAEAGEVVGARAATSAGARRAAAKSAGGKRAAGGASSSAGKRAPVPLPAEGTEARRHRDAVEEIKANRPAEQDDAGDQDQDQDQGSGEGSGQRYRLQPMRPAATGAGFVLGLGAWFCAVQLIQGGPKQLGEFLAAKFLNKTGA